MIYAGYREYVVSSLERYWKNKNDFILGLPVPSAKWPTREPEPPEICQVKLPAWAEDLGIDGCLIVPRWAAGVGGWQQTDWLGSVFWFMNCVAERAYEEKNGPIHSYSFRLNGWDNRLWERAWVNRIALFLRRWASMLHQRDEESIFGPLPPFKIWLTHDIDALCETWPVRIKQATFCLYNAVMGLSEANMPRFREKISQALSFILQPDKTVYIEKLVALENFCGLQGVFFIFAGHKKIANLKSLLIDPSYDISEASTKAVLKTIANKAAFGLHPSFNSWDRTDILREEMNLLNTALGTEVTMCRQHWLRFGWRETWKAQEAAGMHYDYTLGFNDKPGFRNAAALSFCPWDFADAKPMKIMSIPLVLMDSHIYDYTFCDADARKRIMKDIIREIEYVHGEASVLWHPHTLSKNYNWQDGLETLISILTKAR